MTELDLYKWVVEWKPEYRWEPNDDVIIWVSICSLESLLELLPYASLLDEGGIEVRLQKDCIAIMARDICDPLGIDINNVFLRD